MACHNHRGSAFLPPSLPISSSSDVSPRRCSRSSARQIATSTCSGCRCFNTAWFTCWRSDFFSTVVKLTREAPKAVLTPDDTPLKQDECTSTSAASQGAAGDGGSDEHRWHGAGHTRQPSGWVQGGPTGSPQSDLPAGYMRGG